MIYSAVLIVEEPSLFNLEDGVIGEAVVVLQQVLVKILQEFVFEDLLGDFVGPGLEEAVDLAGDFEFGLELGFFFVAVEDV